MKVIDNIKIGQNANENWKLIDESPQNSYWFHLASLPSCHVVCDDNTKLQTCAELCKAHSKYKKFSKVKINYTKISNITKGYQTGSVFYKSKAKVFTITV